MEGAVRTRRNLGVLASGLALCMAIDSFAVLAAEEPAAELPAPPVLLSLPHADSARPAIALIDTVASIVLPTRLRFTYSAFSSTRRVSPGAVLSPAQGMRRALPGTRLRVNRR